MLLVRPRIGYMSYTEQVSSSVSGTLNALCTLMSDMQSAVASFRSSHTSFEQVSASEFVAVLESHQYMRSISQCASALQTISFHLEQNCADVNLAKATLAKP